MVARMMFATLKGFLAWTLLAALLAACITRGEWKRYIQTEFIGGVKPCNVMYSVFRYVPMPNLKYLVAQLCCLIAI